MLILGLRFGYRRGLTKVLSKVIALIVAFITLALILVLTEKKWSYEANTIIFIVLMLCILGAVYGVVRMILKGMKAMSNLPLIGLCDKLLGGVAGMACFLLVYIVFLALGILNMLGGLSPHIIDDVYASNILQHIVRGCFYLYMFIKNLWK